MSRERVDYGQLNRSDWEGEGWKLPDLCVGGVEVVPHKLYTRSGIPVFVYDEKGADVNEGTGFFRVGTDTILMVAAPAKGILERGVQLMTTREDRGQVLTIDDMGRGWSMNGKTEGTVIGQGMGTDQAMSWGEGGSGFGCMQYHAERRGRLGVVESDDLVDGLEDPNEFDGKLFYWEIGYGEGVALIPLLPRRGEPGTGGVLTVRTEHLTEALPMVRRCLKDRELSSTPNVTFQPRMF